MSSVTSNRNPSRNTNHSFGVYRHHRRRQSLILERLVSFYGMFFFFSQLLVVLERNQMNLLVPPSFFDGVIAVGIGASTRILEPKGVAVV